MGEWWGRWGEICKKKAGKHHRREDVGVRTRLVEWKENMQGKWSIPSGDEKRAKRLIEVAKSQEGWGRVHILPDTEVRLFDGMFHCWGDDAHGSWFVLKWTQAGHSCGPVLRDNNICHSPALCPVQHEACRRKSVAWLPSCLPAWSLAGSFEYKIRFRHR